MKTARLLLTALVMITTIISCKKDSGGSNNPATTLRILTGNGQNQTITANIDNNGFTNFNAQTVLADGGNPLHNYTWSLDMSSNPPAGVTIGALTGIINRLGNSSTGLSVGKRTFKVIVSDGTSSVSGSVDLLVTGYTPGMEAVFEQLTSNFSLKNADANKAYGASLFAMGGTPPYSWKLDQAYAGSADLTAAGLTVDATSGVVYGTPMASASGKTIKFRVVVKDNAGETAIGSPVYTIIVN